MRFFFIFPAALLLFHTAVHARNVPDTETPYAANYHLQLNLDRFGIFPLSYEGTIICSRSAEGTRYSIRVHHQPDGVRLLVPEGIDPDPQIAAENAALLVRPGSGAEDEIAEALSGRINIMMLPVLIDEMLRREKIPSDFTVSSKPVYGPSVIYEITFNRSADEQLLFTGYKLSDTGIWLSWECAFIRKGNTHTAGRAILRSAEYNAPHSAASP